MNTLYTFGYAQLSHLNAEGPRMLLDMAKERDAFVMDIRYSPRSRQPWWCKNKLQEVLGASYGHNPALGNVNYKGGPITLAYPELGMRLITVGLLQKSIIILCACKEHSVCHRSLVADMAVQQCGCRVENIYVQRELRKKATQ